MKLAIIGSRTFNDYEYLKESIFDKYKLNEITEIISGGASGADLLAEKFAKEFDLEITVFPADWDKYGKSAGMIRNNDIIKNADYVIAFWDRKSKGTKHGIELAVKNKKELHVIYI